VQNPDLARFMLQTRRTDLLELVESEREEVHREFEEAFSEWATPHFESGDLARMDPILYWAILMGPSDYVAWRWLDGAEEVDLERWARVLGDTAARAVGCGH
jgi:AcrR family transcriptional regulator